MRVLACASSFDEEAQVFGCLLFAVMASYAAAAMIISPIMMKNDAHSAAASRLPVT